MSTTISTAYMLGNTKDWSSGVCAALEHVVALAEELESQAASNADRKVDEKTRHDLWNAFVALRHQLEVSNTDRSSGEALDP